MALEACISLTLFLIAMMALYSLINMFTAQSMISHALQQTGQSIALENYKKFKDGRKNAAKASAESAAKVHRRHWCFPVTQSMMSAEGPSHPMVFTDYLSLSTVKKKVCILSGRKYGKRR